ncbi:MAG: GGDEF domain-containing protein [Desulfitobacteriaceae bacterium]
MENYWTRSDFELNDRIIDNTFYPVFDLKDEVKYIAIFGKDITEQKEYEKKLAYFAIHDSLTGLPNRRFLNEYLPQVIARSKRGNSSILLSIDLDDFKTINDLKGHNAGDEVLKIIAKLFQSCLRTEDNAFRIGGDEFIIILSDIDVDNAVLITERIKLIVNNQDFIFDKQSFKISLSIGLVVIDGKMDLDMILSNVDKLMYKAKKNGKNRVEIYV